MSARAIIARAQAEVFDVGVELGRLEALGAGAVASFTGLVRGDDGLVEMSLEHHPGMTDKALLAIAEEAATRWPLMGITVLHRFGPLRPGERIVFVGTASSHRAAALEACAFLIDWLKTSAPFWKQERFADGSARWVEARAADDAAAARWGGEGA
jgi:molybdopterin synthase catalytic subunit